MLCIIVLWFQFFFAYNKKFTNNEFLAKTRRFKMRYFSVAIHEVFFCAGYEFSQERVFYMCNLTPIGQWLGSE